MRSITFLVVAFWLGVICNDITSYTGNGGKRLAVSIIAAIAFFLTVGLLFMGVIAGLTWLVSS